MSDDFGWVRLAEPWERLRWARARKFEHAKEAADALGMKDSTYRAYERRPDSSKSTRLDHQNAIRFARRFGVRWEWLLLGEGEPWLSGDQGAPASPRERVMRALEGVSPEEQERVAAVVEAMTGKTGTGG